LNRIYVGNLSYQTTEEGLESTFGAYGPVNNVTIIRDRETGKSRGFGFVEMQDEENVQAAIEALNGHEIDGRRLTVNVARPRTGGGGGGAGRSRDRY
jgi:RNA recognition motif-containing protein